MPCALPIVNRPRSSVTSVCWNSLFHSPHKYLTVRRRAAPRTRPSHADAGCSSSVAVVVHRDPPLHHIPDHPVVQARGRITSTNSSCSSSPGPAPTNCGRSSSDAVRAAHHQVHRCRVADAADGVLEGLHVGSREEVLGADRSDGRRTVGDRVRAPGNQLGPLVVVRDADDVRRGVAAEGPRLHLTAPMPARRRSASGSGGRRRPWGRRR